MALGVCVFPSAENKHPTKAFAVMGKYVNTRTTRDVAFDASHLKKNKKNEQTPRNRGKALQPIPAAEQKQKTAWAVCVHYLTDLA